MGGHPYRVSNFRKFKENAPPFLTSSGQLPTVTKIRHNKDLDLLLQSAAVDRRHEYSEVERSINKAEEVRTEYKKGEQLQ